MLGGCASVQDYSGLPDYSDIGAVPQAQRADYYKSRGVAEIEGDTVRIGGTWYNRDQFWKICRDLDSRKAAKCVRAVKPTKRWLEMSALLSVGGALLSGWGLGYEVYIFTSKVGSTSGGIPGTEIDFYGGNSAYISEGTLIGLGLGLAVFGIEYYFHQKHTHDSLSKARDYFNQDLWKRLNFDLIPKADGVNAGVSTKF